MSIPVRGHRRNGRWVRPHQRRGVAAAGGASVITLATVLALGHFGFTSLSGPPGRSAELVRVVDGDTMDVSLDNTTTRVRLIGIDAPEMGRKGNAAECYAEKATEQLAKLMGDGTGIKVRTDPTQPEHDRYGRLLAYVYVHADDVGEQLVRDGYARSYQPRGQERPEHLATYRELHRKARSHHTGLWSC